MRVFTLETAAFGTRSNTIVASGVLCAALLLGGGTRPGLFSDVIIELIALPICVAALALFLRHPELRSHRPYALAALCVALIPLVQLIPFPPDVWSRLPGRDLVLDALAIPQELLPWRPLTISTAATIGSFLSLAPPLALFLLVLLLTYKERRTLSLLLIAFGLLSIVLAFVQLSQGPESPLRFYEITNVSEGVGFFANRNHFAALLYMLLPLVAAWVIATALELGSDNRKSVDGFAAFLLASFVAVFAILLLAQAMASSRAGMGIAVIAALASFALAWPFRHRKVGVRAVKLLFAASALGCILVAQYALYRIIRRFDIDVVDQYRVEMARQTWAAVKLFLPFGSGLGTFVPVYFGLERAEDADSEYVNRAHSDFLESFLEIGIVAPIIVLGFFVWWSYRASRVWHHDVSRPNLVDASLRRAASIVVLLPLAHSIFDYPLRTISLMTVFAFAVALMIDPVQAERDDCDQSTQSSKRRSRRRSRSGRTNAASLPGRWRNLHSCMAAPVCCVIQPFYSGLVD